MISLSLDTSEKNLSIGLDIDGSVFTLTEPAFLRQSEILVERIDETLKSHRVSPLEIERIIVTNGPGSYTGVRIALTVAKVMALASGAKLYLASSLEGLCPAKGRWLCLDNARGKRSYMGVYADGECLLKDCIKDNSEVVAYINDHPDLTPIGDLAYLGLPSPEFDVAKNLLSRLDDSHLCHEPLSARPVYLKDDYEAGTFKITVRKTLPSDLDAIMDIEAESFLHPYTREQMLSELSQNPCAHVYSALVDAEVVGFIDFMITFNSATISQIAVRKDMRSKGIGNRLIGQMIKDCEAQSDPVEYITLEVRQSNEKAQKFYKRHKFEPILVKKGYYDDGEDAVYMVRSIVHG